MLSHACAPSGRARIAIRVLPMATAPRPACLGQAHQKTRHGLPPGRKSSVSISRMHWFVRVSQARCA